MTLGEFRMIDHPKGREAIVGWAVETTEGLGIVRGFKVNDQKNRKPDDFRWVVLVELVRATKKYGKVAGFFPEEITLLRQKGRRK